ncbi:phage antirepressor N-terminal domain-containing protein [Acidovorax delafieldii]|nr:phage antirepressor N-terminal domain-containing protein [Acidovorax delafieldii]
MADSTQHNATRAITVPFHGADLYVVEHNGQPYTPMKPIVTAMGLDWGSQFRKVAANEARWGVLELRIPSTATVVDSTIVGSADGKSRELTCIPVRKVAAWLATVEPGKVKNPDVRARVIQYQNECDDVLWRYWNDGIAINPRALYSVNPGDVLTKAEADTLRQTIEGMAKKLSADTNVQGKFIMQAWSKLKSHFHVSYREIPRHELTEAISIVNRHTVEWELVDEAPKAGTVQEIVADWVKKIESPNGYPAVLFEPIVEAVQRKIGHSQPAQSDAARTKAAFDAASQAAASVQSAVFNAVLSGNDEWKYSRWVLAFIDDSAKGSPAYVRQLEHGSFTTTWPRLVRDVGTGECMSTTAELLDMAYACMQRLAQRGATTRLAA